MRRRSGYNTSTSTQLVRVFECIAQSPIINRPLRDQDVRRIIVVENELERLRQDQRNKTKKSGRKLASASTVSENGRPSERLTIAVADIRQVADGKHSS